MKRTAVVLAASLACLVLSGPVAVSAAEATNAPTKALTPQQQRMKDCNKDAAEKKLHGAERKKFMKECLSTKPKAPASETAPPQQGK
jgi:hypothetical protein